MALYQGLTPVSLITSDAGCMRLGEDFVVPAKSIPVPSPISDWRYSTLSNGTKLLKEYLGSNTKVRVPYTNTLINSASRWKDDNAPFTNNQVIENLDLMQVPFKDNNAAYAFSSSGNIKSITNMNQNFSNIFQAFAYCSSLKKLNLTIPDSVTHSLGYLCDSCSNLTDVNIVIGNNVCGYHQSIFKNCTNLVNVSLTIPIWNGCYDLGYNLNNLTNLEILNVNTFVNYNDSTSVLSLYKYNTIKNIKITSNAQFNDNTNRFMVSLGNTSATDIIFDVPNLTNISYAFTNCFNLTNLSLNCPNLTNMCYAFRNCSNLSSIPTIPNSVTDLKHTFENTAINNITMDIYGDNKELIGTFTHCNELTDVNMKFIGNNIHMRETFSQCPKLKNVKLEIDKNATEISSLLSLDNLDNLEITSDSPNIFKQGWLGYSNVNVTNFKFSSNIFPSSYMMQDIKNSMVNCTLNLPYATTMYDVFNGVYNKLENVFLNAPLSTNMSRAFWNCQKFTYLDKIPENTIDLSMTFRQCYNLVDAPVIPNSVTNMHQAFYTCTNLINAPEIPNSVTDISSAFSECTNLVNAPVIPNSVTNMCGTFYYCNNLTNASVISNNVTNMSSTFRNCSNLTGDIYIYSEKVNDVMYCFNGTSLQKNVYIPFTYENSVNTQTYNLFKQYYGSGQNGVTLFDINQI